MVEVVVYLGVITGKFLKHRTTFKLLHRPFGSGGRSDLSFARGLFCHWNMGRRRSVPFVLCPGLVARGRFWVVLAG